MGDEAVSQRFPPIGATRRWGSLAALIVVALFSIVDRQIFILLAEPVRLDLGLTDIQLGMLQGLGFSAFAALVSLPIGWLVDTYDRRMVLAACIGVWSVAVMACGFAGGFASLFVASMCVGAGEAGVIPVAYAVIPSLFAGAQRQFANALYTLAGRLGLGAAMALCGALILLVGQLGPHLPGPLGGMAEWRLCFLVAGCLGPVMVAILFVIPRAHALPDAVDAGAPSPPDGSARLDLTPFMRLHRHAYIGFFGAMAFAMFGLTALTTWLPIVAIRHYGLSPAEAGAQFGLVTLVASIAGLGGTAILVRLGGDDDQPRLALRVLIFASAGAGIVAACLPFTTDRVGLLSVYALHLSIATFGTMVYPTALQAMAPDHLRGRAVALMGMVQFVASALAPPIVGWLSGVLDPAGGRLLVAIVMVAVPSIGLCCLLFAHSRQAFSTAVAHARQLD